MIVSSLALIVLGIVMSTLWVAWWLVADLFGDRTPNQPGSSLQPTSGEGRNALLPSERPSAIERIDPSAYADSIAAAISHMASVDEPRTTAVPTAEWTIRS